jgi:hypothetical protein
MATPFRCVAEEFACVAKWLGWSVTVLAGMFAFTLLVAKIPTDRKNTSRYVFPLRHSRRFAGKKNFTPPKRNRQSRDLHSKGSH